MQFPVDPHWPQWSWLFQNRHLLELSKYEWRIGMELNNTQIAWHTRVFHKIDAPVHKHRNMGFSIANRFKRLSEIRKIGDLFLSAFEKLVNFLFIFSLLFLLAFLAFFLFAWLLLFLLSLLQGLAILAWCLLFRWRPRLKQMQNHFKLRNVYVKGTTV